jgi:hypothetical protein
VFVREEGEEEWKPVYVRVYVNENEGEGAHTHTQEGVWSLCFPTGEGWKRDTVVYITLLVEVLGALCVCVCVMKMGGGSKEEEEEEERRKRRKSSRKGEGGEGEKGKESTPTRASTRIRRVVGER